MFHSGILLIVFIINWGYAAISVVLQSPRVTKQGTWGSYDYCSKGTYVFGMMLKVQQWEGPGTDNSALNGVTFTCAQPHEKLLISSILRSEIGPFGKYGKLLKCEKSSFAVGFQLRSQASINGDNTAGNNLRLICDNLKGNNIHGVQGYGLKFGNWSKLQLCPKGYAICGMRTQVEVYPAKFGDYTGLNNIDVQCCVFSSTLFSSPKKMKQVFRDEYDVVIRNLNEYLRPFSNCLVQLINYRGIDLHEPEVPMVMTRYDIFVYTRQNNGLPYNVYVPTEIEHLNEQNGSLSTDTILEKVPRDRDFTSTAKNFRCTFQLFVYPPSDEGNGFDRFIMTTSKMLLVPQFVLQFGKFRPKFDISSTHYFERRPHEAYAVLLTKYHEKIKANQNWVQVYASAIDRRSKVGKLLSFIDLLIFSTEGETFVSGKTVQRNTSLQPTIETIRDDVIYLCRYCKVCYIFHPVLLKITNFTQLASSKIQNYLAFHKSPPTGFQAPWILYGEGLDGSWVNRDFFRFYRGHKHYFPKPELQSVHDSKYGTAYKAQEFAAIIFSNHSYLKANTASVIQEKICKNNPNYLYQCPTLNMAFTGPYYDLILYEGQRSFRFVQCCTTKTGVVSFDVLYDAFDNILWISILATYFILLLFISKILQMTKKSANQKVGVFEVVFSGYSILVEQSTNIINMNDVDIVGFIRWVFGPLALFGIVLSNAYKGENINKLTSPQKLIQYDTLDQLLDNQFDIYQTTDHSLLKMLMGASPPVLSEARLKLLDKLIISDKSHTVWKKLLECVDKMVVYAPSDAAFENAAKLHRERKSFNLRWAVGEESIHGKWKGWRIINNVDPHVQKNLDRGIESGIFDQWTEMARRKRVLWGTPDYEAALNKKERAALALTKKVSNSGKPMGVKGSIVTVFIMLFTGIAFSLFTFLGELKLHIWIFMKMAFVKRLYQKQLRIFRQTRVSVCKSKI